MAYEQKPNTGALFKAKDRATDRHPEYTGSINIDGKDYWLSAWVKEGQAQKFFSLAVKPKDEKPTPKQDAPVKGGPKSFDDFKGDIPFR